MTEHEKLWIIGATSETGVTIYMVHPRGGTTRNPEQAYGYFYRTDANEEAFHWQTKLTKEFLYQGSFVKRRDECTKPAEIHGVTA
jgi:hypothetical protein